MKQFANSLRVEYKQGQEHIFSLKLFFSWLKNKHFVDELEVNSGEVAVKVWNENDHLILGECLTAIGMIVSMLLCLKL